MLISDLKYQIFKYLSKKQRLNLYNNRFFYLNLSKLSNEELEKYKILIQKYINIYRHRYKKLKIQFPVNNIEPNTNNLVFNEDLNFQFFITNNTTINFFIFKFGSLLMKNGKKQLALKYFYKFLNILKLEFKIKNPLKIFIKTLFYNIIPTIGTKTVGFKNKKILGVVLSTNKRFSKTIKLFIKGARSHNSPILTGLLIEFFKLISGKSLLNKYNKEVESLIFKNKLYKFLKLPLKNLRPETRFFQKQSDLKNIIKILNIDWPNIKYIMNDLHILNLKLQYKRQNACIQVIKNYLLSKHNLLKFQYDIFYVELFKQELLEIDSQLLHNLDLDDIYGILYLKSYKNKLLHLNPFKFKHIPGFLKMYNNYSIWEDSLEQKQILNDQL